MRGVLINTRWQQKRTAGQGHEPQPSLVCQIEHWHSRWFPSSAHIIQDLYYFISVAEDLASEMQEKMLTSLST